MNRTKAILSMGIVALLMASIPLAGMQPGGAAGSGGGLNADESVNERTYHMSFSEPVIVTGGKYSALVVREADHYTMSSGEPSMPVAVKTFTFPFGTNIKNVECSVSGVSEYSIGGKIAPSLGAVRMDGSEKVELKENSNVYDSSDWYPDGWFNYGIK